MDFHRVLSGISQQLITSSSSTTSWFKMAPLAYFCTIVGGIQWYSWKQAHGVVWKLVSPKSHGLWEWPSTGLSALFLPKPPLPKMTTKPRTASRTAGQLNQSMTSLHCPWSCQNYGFGISDAFWWLLMISGWEVEKNDPPKKKESLAIGNLSVKWLVVPSRLNLLNLLRLGDFDHPWRISEWMVEIEISPRLLDTLDHTWWLQPVATQLLIWFSDGIIIRWMNFVS